MTVSSTRWGRSCRNRPATTATAAWIAKALVDPTHTANGRPRLPMTMLAIIVLSGSSATATSPNTVAAMARFMSAPPTGVARD
jgi:hypothetical protein